MLDRVVRKLQSWLGHNYGSARSRKSQKGTPDAAVKPGTGAHGGLTPIERFYENALQKHLSEFTSFAIQSRSLAIRDVFAWAASEGRLHYTSLIGEIDAILASPEEEQAPLLRTARYNTELLLSLARLVLNSADDDLDTQTGVLLYELVLLREGEQALSAYHKLQFVEALTELRRYGELGPLLRDFNIPDLAPLQSELINLDRIAYEGSPQEWISTLNELYLSLEMAPVRLIDSDALPLLDRLESATQVKRKGPVITVLVPTYAPGVGIRTALRSLIQQTWEALEIIVIDDGSPEEHNDLLTEIANLDPRIRVLRQSYNAGAYVARNAGLSIATGEFVTVHDDDDWSHPEKLASQVEILLTDNSVVATTSAHIRTTEDMQFRRVNARPQHLQTNYSSLMFRRSISEEIGVWDTANRGSDAEYVLRLREHYGPSSIAHLIDKPLSFSRVWSGSLTSGEMYRGYFAYSRLVFRSAFRQWHIMSKKSGSKLAFHKNTPRPYPIPSSFEPGGRHKDLGKFDIIYVTDFAKQAKYSSTVVTEIESASRSGLRVGYMHINSPRTLKKGEISARLFSIQMRGEVVQVGEKDKASTDLLLVYDAAIGMFLDRFKSTVVVKRGLVIEDQGVILKGASYRDPSNVRQALAHIDASFDQRFSIVGASPKEQALLHESVPPERLLDEEYIWTEHVSARPGAISAPSTTPVVGFHSFGNRYRWPSTRTKFDQAYLSDRFLTKFYGRVDPVRNQFGADALAGVEVIDFRTSSSETFFDAIDFWIYHPHEKLEDRVWLPVLEALQAGKVVILPKRFESIYGSAAVYADISDIETAVCEFSADHQKYLTQARRAQAFINHGFDEKSYIRRIVTLASQLTS